MSKDDGGFAFPVSNGVYRATGPREDIYIETDSKPGMSLRDYFAAHAPEMTEQWWLDTKADKGHYAEAQAAYAYFYADAMIKERNKD